MKKMFLSLFFMALSATSLFAMNAARDVFVDQVTYNFVDECGTIWFQEDCCQVSSIRYDAIGAIFKKNSEKIKTGLKTIDSSLGELEFDPAKDDLDKVKAVLNGQNVKIRLVDQTTPVVDQSTPVVDQTTPVNSQLRSILNSPSCKASCAAATAGIAMYYAIGFYNKDKAKERQLSNLKWSLGVAVVVGAGTYWYVQ